MHGLISLKSKKQALKAAFVCVRLKGCCYFLKSRLNRANTRFVRFLKRLCAKIKRSEKALFYGLRAGAAQAVSGPKTGKKILQSHFARLQNFHFHSSGFPRKNLVFKPFPGVFHIFSS